MNEKELTKFRILYLNLKVINTIKIHQEHSKHLENNVLIPYHQKQIDFIDSSIADVDKKLEICKLNNKSRSS